MSTVQYYRNLDDFALESGEVLNGLELAFSTLGKLNDDKSNVIWVCHALTGNTNVLEWWPGLFGDGGAFNPNDYFIVCANMLGGCYGSTGPLTSKLNGEGKFYHTFPLLTNLDIVRAFDLLRAHLEITQIQMVVGGSMGGQQALEWAVWKPQVFKRLIALATNARHSPWAIAFNEAQRMAITADQTWQSSDDEAGMSGMRAARAVGMLSYRSYHVFKDKQQDDGAPIDNYKASSYQQYQGEKLTKRFNAFTYWTLSKAMDSHDVGRNRGGTKQALSRIEADCHFIGIDSDILFPTKEQRYLADHTQFSTLDIITSAYGHDGFLIEFDQINSVLKRLL